MAKLTKRMHSVAIFDRLCMYGVTRKISNYYVIANIGLRWRLEMEQNMHVVSNNLHRNNWKTLNVAASFSITYF